MKLETIFEKFDLFADAPDAVRKMRELVLELAVRGKLVAQEVSKKSLTEAHRHREAIDESGIPYPAPVGWWWVTLYESAECRAAAKVSPSTIPDDAWVLDLEDIDGDTGTILQTVKFYDRRSLSTKAVFQAGDVLYGKLRPYLNKVVIAPKAGYCTTEIVPLRPLKFLSPYFLRFFLRSATFLRYAAAKNYGMKMPRLGTKDLESAPIVIPPLAEQKRIVAKVDELMALCDKLEAEQKAREEKKAALARAALARFAKAPTPDNLALLFYPSPCLRASVRKLKQVSHKGTEAQSPSSFLITPADLRKTILTLAVQGKLVPQDPNDEPAKVSEVSRNENGAISIGDNITQIKQPNNWKLTRLGRVCELINGDRSKNYPNKEEYVLEGVPWINTGHIEPDGTLSVARMHYITRQKFNSLRSGKVRSGDLVYCLRGATLGKTAIITQLDEGAIASSLVIIRISPIIVPRFAYMFLMSPLGREQIFRFDNGSAQPNLSANNVKKYWIPIPPLAEQHRIVAKVDQLMALVDELEAQLAASQATGEKLLTALVAELTAGKEIQAAAQIRSKGHR